MTRKGQKRKALTKEETLYKYGVRSGLEERVTEQLNRRKIEFSYEEATIHYIKPAKKCKYTPDFILIKSGIIIETKGRFTLADRQKHEYIKKQDPTLDIRFVFTNPNAKISKASKTTYAMWCEKHGFKYAKGLIPEEWLNE